MYFGALITVTVLLNSVISDEINVPVISATPGEKFQNINVKENSSFHFIVKDIPSEKPSEVTKCGGECLVTGTERIFNYSSCIISRNESKYYLDVTISNYLVSKNNINWTCFFDMKDPSQYMGDQSLSKVSFQLNVLNAPATSFLGTMELVYMVVAFIILIIIIIIGQTICIVHFRRKAKAVRMHASLSKRNESIEETVRYSKMPGQKINIEPCDESRESCIYEVLADLRVPPVPEPPSLKTLPRPAGATHRATSPSTPADPAPAASAMPRTLTNGTLLPYTLRKKQPKDSESDKKRTTVERIKERAPMPIPGEEIYEVMDASPPPSRKEFPRTQVLPKKEPIAKKDTLPKPEIKKKGYTPLQSKPALPSSIKNGPGNTLKPQILPSQLKEALELRSRGNTLEAGALRVTPFNPGLPPPLATLSKPSTSQVPPRPDGAARPWAGRAPPPGPSASGPVAHGPGATGPSGGPAAKWKPPPPVKPKQLHPLPHVPESIHVTTAGDEGGGCSSDEEWIYEPLEDPSSYNIYSI